jgi:hypothetical protein
VPSQGGLTDSCRRKFAGEVGHGGGGVGWRLVFCAGWGRGKFAEA